MSRRKQSNPKPLLKSECQDTAEDMTVERETKDLSPSDLNEQADAASADIDQSMEPRTPFTTESLMEENRPSSSTPRTLSPPSDPEADDQQSPSVRSDAHSEAATSPSEHDDSLPIPASTMAVIPKLRLNALLASDPALNPDARNLKILHEESTKNHHHEEAIIAAATAAAAGTTTNASIASANAADQKAGVKTPAPAVVDNAQRVKVFMCLPCGIGFSSRSTLEAHQAYYCSHRKEAEEDPAGSGAGSTSSGDKNSTITSGEPSVKSIKTGKQYACTQCSYSADKKVSLNRHMRMHQSSPAPSSNASNGGDDSSSQQIDRYCSECDIRFSNVKTYRAHKQHYCSSRRNDGQTTPKLTEPGVKTSGGSVSPPHARTKTPTPAAVVAAAAAAAAAAIAPQPFIALPTNPILIIPYYLIRAASMIPGPLTSVSSGIVNPESTCFSLENGSLKPMATALSTNSISNNQMPPVETTQRLSHPPPPSTPSNNDTNVVSPLLTEKNTRAVSANSCNDPAKPVKKDIIVRDFAPLDLSLRRSPVQRSQRIRSSSTFLPPSDERLDFEAMMEGKENLSIDSGSMTPEQIVCAPSLPNSPSMSPSPKRRALSPRSSSAASMSPVPSSAIDHLPLRPILPADIVMKLTDSNVITPLMAKQNLELAFKLSSASAAAAVSAASKNSKPNESNAAINNPLLGLPGAPISVGAASSGQPQIFVKQGVSKCKECNIVFCKYENYLAHKQHYCSARNQEDTENKISTPPSASNSGVETNPIAYQQLICAACGIKYTSLDNLRAHQKFYCPKGGGDAASAPPVVKEKCSKCKVLHEVGQACPPLPAATQQGSYKCPVCDVVSLTTAESRKHLETHSSVKAFRCSICRYKGNTLRGMRTHIRMHFDKKTSDFNEENYMSCILEEDGLEIPSPASLNPEQLSQFAAAHQQHQQQHLLQQQAAAQQQQLQQQQQQQHSPQNPHNCEFCNYSSSYKGNVMRHMKLVHSQPGTSPSISPEMIIDDGEPISQSVNGDNTSTLPEGFSIKAEPLESLSTATVKNNNISTPNHHHQEPLAQIKTEPIDVAEGVIRSLSSPLSVPPPPLNSTSPLSGDENSLLRNSSSIGSGVLPFNQKYCQTCDITFNYMKTYLAHKQFYCKNKPHGDTDSPSPVPPVQSPTMLNKNKENLEAAIL